MSLDSPDDSRAVAYLLGKLPEAEQVLLEQQVLADDALYERVLAIEDELMYAYLHGDLGRDDRARFEQRFLFTEEGRRREAFARLLTQALGAGEPHRRRAAAAYWIPLAAAAVLVIACGWLAIERVRLRRENTRLRAEQAEQIQSAQQQIAAARAQAAPRIILSVMLASGLKRADGIVPRLLLPMDVESVRLQLTLAGPASFREYRTVVRNADGRLIWSGQAAPSSEDRSHLAVDVPARPLAPDDYELTLTGLTENGRSQEIGTYYFSVASGLNRPR